MNIFAVDADPRIAALQLPDKLVPKMIVESAQMLSTAHRVLDGDAGADFKNLYKKAYENHPSCIWVREDALNYWWLWMHALTLCEEYSWRFSSEDTKKSHKTIAVIHFLEETPKNIPTFKTDRRQILEDLPLCMPEQYKADATVWEGHLSSYQKFITQDKPYMQDVFKAYANAIRRKDMHKDSHESSNIDYPPAWVSKYATAEQRKHIDLHKLMNPETTI